MPTNDWKFYITNDSLKFDFQQRDIEESSYQKSYRAHTRSTDRTKAVNVYCAWMYVDKCEWWTHSVLLNACDDMFMALKYIRTLILYKAMILFSFVFFLFGLDTQNGGAWKRLCCLQINVVTVIVLVSRLNQMRRVYLWHLRIEWKSGAQKEIQCFQD